MSSNRKLSEFAVFTTRLFIVATCEASVIHPGHFRFTPKVSGIQLNNKSIWTRSTTIGNFVLKSYLQSNLEHLLYCLYFQTFRIGKCEFFFSIPLIRHRFASLVTHKLIYWSHVLHCLMPRKLHDYYVHLECNNEEMKWCKKYHRRHFSGNTMNRGMSTFCNFFEQWKFPGFNVVICLVACVISVTTCCRGLIEKYSSAASLKCEFVIVFWSLKSFESTHMDYTRIKAQLTERSRGNSLENFECI